MLLQPHVLHTSRPSLEGRQVPRTGGHYSCCRLHPRGRSCRRVRPPAPTARPDYPGARKCPVKLSWAGASLNATHRKATPPPPS
ncbi:hypothetical protein B296_00053559 [Ensete ventricosum]|uniref:Uncharacterized protein n=1 Tax=Ensete ventricosum TaxID=4639 RepID=A0A426WWU8_ENSVE|nr:hypothetical protein B296_00053559 [Ensete ventricosum]